MLCWAEEIGAIFTELSIAKGQELIVAVSNPNAVIQGSVHAREQLVVSLLIGTCIDSSLLQLANVVESTSETNLEQLVGELHPEKSAVSVLLGIAS